MPGKQIHLEDPDWRLSNLYRIQDKKGRDVTFQPNAAQRALLSEMHSFNLILKARQLGFTTLIGVWALDQCLFRDNVRAGIIAHTVEDAEEIFRTKVKFPFERLPASLRRIVKARHDSARQLTFPNGSSLRVGTSMRSGTLNILHISEYGKICARYPEKAREIRTGALNAVEQGQTVFIESTAEGREGDFYALYRSAKAKADAQMPLSPMDFKLHFFPWWRDPDYRLRAEELEPEPAPFKTYFLGLERDHGVKLDDAQRAWYVKKAEIQGDDMKREYPSLPEEAFESALQGAYFAPQIARARKEGRILNIPHEPGIEVNTFWDLGMDDSTAIWFHQRVGLENRFIHYYENSGEALPHYVGYLRSLGYEIWGEHYLPHDVMVRSLGDGKTRKQVLQENGLSPVKVVPRPANLGEAIEMVRQSLSSCWFDLGGCASGLNALEIYRREWDGKLGVYKSQPLHDAASHGADAFRLFATGYRARSAAAIRPVFAKTAFRKGKRS